MKFNNGVIRPGVVLQVLEGGYIKASAPGLFSEKDDPELLPPIQYFFSTFSNSFSSVNQYDDVWIINYLDNPQQLYWIRKDNLSNNEDIMKEENVEIICNRETECDWATIYFSNGSGWIIKKDSSVIQIRKDGTIKLAMNYPKRTIDINFDNISLGSEGNSKYKAVLGDNLVTTLTLMISLFNAIGTAAKSNPYTAVLGQLIEIQLPTIENSLNNILSQNITLE